MNPFPIIMSSPSGGGKTTIARTLLERRADVGYSVSCTTRLPRPGEVDGLDYYFLSTGEFGGARDRREFAESAEVHGKLYGTLRREIERVLGEGRHVLMDIDVQGARQLLTAFPQSVAVYLLPPSAEVLLTRLRARKTENTGAVAVRVRSAVEELQAIDSYGYVVVNDDLERAVSGVSAIIDAECLRRHRIAGLSARVSELIAQLEDGMPHDSPSQG
ncbi:MAG: guanylate kinase [Gemmatimonadaceae bacterium]